MVSRRRMKIKRSRIRKEAAVRRGPFTMKRGFVWFWVITRRV